MELIINWVTQIIIFLLLAAIIDLLVPANAMKKYVKFVIGLILILIFLKPIFHIFQFDITQALQSSFISQIESENDAENVENLIEIQKSEIESSQNAYILEQMAVQLKDIAKDPLLETYAAEISSIDFTFKSEESVSYENLEEVIVHMRDTENGEGVVNAVDDVVINTDDGPITVQEDKKIAQIKGLLQEVWGLQDEKLTIEWEGGTS